MEAKSYWELANYIVAFDVVQALALAYILSESRPGMRSLIQNSPVLLPRLVWGSCAVFVLLIVGCWLVEDQLLRLENARSAIVEASWIAFIGRLVVVFATAIGLYALVKKVKKLVVGERESFAYSSECV